VAGKRKCAVVSGGNIDAGVLANCCPNPSQPAAQAARRNARTA
jgi:hypothetical protein